MNTVTLHMYVSMSYKGLHLSAYMSNTQSEEDTYGILFIFSLFYEHSNLAYVRIHVKQSRVQPWSLHVENAERRRYIRHSIHV